MQQRLFPKVCVGVIIHNNENKIFLAQSYKWQDSWCVPGGHLECGETLEQCAKREIKEETNLEIEQLELVCTQEAIFSNEFHEKRHFIFFDYCAKLKSGNIKLNDELKNSLWINPKEALKLNLNSFTKKLIGEFVKKKRL